MGAYCSIHNDTQDETVMVYVGVNTKVLQPILWSITGAATLLSGGVAMGSVPGILSVTIAGEASVLISVSTLTAAAGGFVSATNFVLEQLQTQLVNDLAKGGYHKLLPGQTYTTQKLTPGLNLRAWIVRIQKTDHAIIIKRGDASVWSGPKPGSRAVYRVLDKRVFSQWTNHETIPIGYEHCPQEISTEEDADNNAAVDTHKGNVTTHNMPWLKHETDEPFTLLDSGRINCHFTVVETKEEPFQLSSRSTLDKSTFLGETNDDDAWDLVDTDLQNEWVQIDTAKSHHQDRLIGKQYQIP